MITDYGHQDWDIVHGEKHLAPATPASIASPHEGAGQHLQAPLIRVYSSIILVSFALVGISFDLLTGQAPHCWSGFDNVDHQD